MSWQRLEGATRDPNLGEGLSARIADPLWTLARQWQVGEFHGEDAASPIVVQADLSFTPLTAFAPGRSQDADGAVARADADRPLEVMIEQESAAGDLRLSLELGWMLLRSLAQAGLPATTLGALRREYEMTLPPDDGFDPVGRGQLALIARRALDGHRLAADLDRDPGAPRALLERLGVPARRRKRIARVLSDWLDTVGDFVRQPDSTTSWADAPLEYRFRVAAPLTDGELTFEASEYRGGTLDWYHFRHAPEAAPLAAGGRPSTHHITVLPTPLRFHGMPASRFWAIEDRTVSFGDLVGGAEDLARAVVGAFAAVYEDDWLVVPCRLPVGCISRVAHLTVLDDYGHSHDIEATAALDGPGRVWRFFELEGDDGPDAAIASQRQAPMLMLAPALPDTEEGPPLERVDLLRDQAANLAWAIERRAVGASGRPIDRDAHANRNVDPPVVGALWSYQAYTPVPENWIPLVPVRTGDDRSPQTHLRRGRMAEPAPGLDERAMLPLGRLLDASRPLRIHEEAIPEAGLRVDRRYQRARDGQGRVHLWIGRRVRNGAWPARAGFSTDRLHRQTPDEG